jgi:hypothetical protein
MCFHTLPPVPAPPPARFVTLSPAAGDLSTAGSVKGTVCLTTSGKQFAPIVLSAKCGAEAKLWTTTPTGAVLEPWVRWVGAAAGPVDEATSVGGFIKVDQQGYKGAAACKHGVSYSSSQCSRVSSSCLFAARRPI